MLEGLDQIPWDTLEHAYGPAGDVPEQLRALTSADAEAREEALYALYGNIWHQGTVYAATAPAVPFLVEIALSPAVEGRKEVLDLLYAIAHGSSYLDVHQHLSHVGDMLKAEADFDARRAQELADVRAAQASVSAAHPQLLELLERDRDPEVRRHAARLLGACALAKELVSAELLRRQEAEPEPSVRAAMLFVLGSIDIQRHGALLAQQLDERAAIVRLASAMAIGCFGEPPLPRAVTEVLLSHLADLDLVDYSLFPFADDAASDIAGALAKADAPERERAAALLLDHARSKRAPLLAVGTSLFALSFPTRPDQPRLQELSPLQREALELVAKAAWSRTSQGGWSIFGNFVDLLSEYGLEALGKEITGYR
jgi:hypothetical protein